MPIPERGCKPAFPAARRFVASKLATLGAEHMTEATQLTVRSIDAAGIPTAYIDVGTGDAVLMIHGSGPGASAISTWRGTIPALHGRRAVGLDLAGFGASSPRGEIAYTVSTWAQQCFALLDALGIERT